jgi:hypothetical protein
MHQGSHIRRALLTPLVVLGLCAAVLAGVIALNGPAGANHDDIPCNDDVPSGYECVPLVNKPDSGPGIGTPAVGELFYQFVDADTLRIAIRALPGEGAVDAGTNHQLCIDDDNEPYSEGSIGSNEPPHCTGGGAGAVDVTDGSSGIPDASGEPDDDSAAGLDGQYEVRVTGMVSDGTVDTLPYYDFNNIDGYSFFVYHVNIGQSSTQAFWTDTPTVTTPSPTASPTASPPTASPTASPTVTASPPTVTASPPTVTASPPTVTASPPTVTASPPTATAVETPEPTPTPTNTPTNPPTSPATNPPTTPATNPPTSPPAPSPTPTAQQATQTPVPSTPPPVVTTPAATASPTALLATLTPRPATPQPTALNFPPTGGGPMERGSSLHWLLLFTAGASLLLAGSISLASARSRDD